MLTSFEEKFGKKGAMISAVDLLKGIATGAGMHNIPVDGANGGLHTNYAGKAKAAVKALTQEGYDFAYIHVEAPDEMGHQGSFKNKITAIENIDAHIIGPVAEMLEAAGGRVPHADTSGSSDTGERAHSYRRSCAIPAI